MCVFECVSVRDKKEKRERERERGAHTCWFAGIYNRKRDLRGMSCIDVGGRRLGF